MAEVAAEARSVARAEARKARAEAREARESDLLREGEISSGGKPRRPCDPDPGVMCMGVTISSTSNLDRRRLMLGIMLGIALIALMLLGGYLRKFMSGYRFGDATGGYFCDDEPVMIAQQCDGRVEGVMR
jgi:hypothetical protein